MVDSLLLRTGYIVSQTLIPALLTKFFQCPMKASRIACFELIFRTISRQPGAK